MIRLDNAEAPTAQEVCSVTLLNRSQVTRLARNGNGPHVSLFMPTHRAGREVAQDPVRFKNLVTRSEAELEAAGYSSRIVAETLAPARALLDDEFFWQHASDGLAVLLAAGQADVFRLPAVPEELVVVGDRAHLKPLLATLVGDGAFHVLALSQSSVRLFEATRDGIREIDLQDVPTSLRAAVGYDYEQRSLQFHTGAGPGKGGMRRAMFHGHGEGSDEDKAEVAEFLQLVDGGVHALIGELGGPIVLAGVGWVTAMYRGLTRIPDVLPDGIDGSPDRMSREELHQRAWAIVEPRFLAAAAASVGRYAELAGTPRASDDLAVVLRAAGEGRVESLHVDVARQVWGRWSPEALEAEIHEEQRPGDRDLLDVAALTALENGAQVFATAPGSVPGGGPIAAVFRY